MKETIVVNLRSEPYDVYIGRTGKGMDGYFGNPFSRKTSNDPVRDFEKYFHKRVKKDSVFRKKVFKLQGKRLGCFCKPRECHGDVIVNFLNSYSQKPSKIGVIGSRSFQDYEFMKEILSWYNIKEIISGGAKGADKLAAKYARENELKLKEFIPDWDAFGRSAGFRRNKLIVDYADEIIAFWDGESKGTKSSIDMAEELGKNVYIFWPIPSDDPIAEFGL